MTQEFSLRIPRKGSDGSSTVLNNRTSLPNLFKRIVAHLFRQERPKVIVHHYSVKKTDAKALQDAKTKELAEEVGGDFPRRVARARYDAMRMRAR